MNPFKHEGDVTKQLQRASLAALGVTAVGLQRLERVARRG